MSGAEDTLSQLSSRLFDVPQAEFEALVRSLEARRLRPDHKAAADLMLGRLRPRLAITRPRRQATPQRLFCIPFEDLLYDPGTPRKALGRIPRSAIPPVWKLFCDQTPAGTIDSVVEGLRAMKTADREALEFFATPLWAEAARVLDDRLAGAAATKDGRAALQAEVGGPEVLASLEEIAAALRIAEPIAKLRRSLPEPPIADVDADGLAALLDALTRAAAISRESVPIVVFSLLARLRNPAVLFDLLQRLAEEGAGDLVRGLAAQAGEAVISQTEDRLVDAQAAIQAAETAKVEVARSLGRELAALDKAAAAAGSGGGRALVRRLERAKADLGRLARETVVAGSDRATLDAIAALDEPATADGDDLARLRAVEDRIVSLRLCQKFARELGIDSEVAGSLKTISAGLDDRAKGLLKRLEANDPDVSSVDLFSTVRLVELVEGPEKAEKLRQKGMQAMTGKG